MLPPNLAALAMQIILPCELLISNFTYAIFGFDSCCSDTDYNNMKGESRILFNTFLIETIVESNSSLLHFSLILSLAKIHVPK